MDDKTINLRYGIIVAYNKHCRFIIARIDQEPYPLVFLREWEEDKFDEYYSLYNNALTVDEADEILDCLKNDDMRKARTLLKRYFKEEGLLCEFVGEARLDDAVPDSWYDVWKELEAEITIWRDLPGYCEKNAVCETFE